MKSMIWLFKGPVSPQLTRFFRCFQSPTRARNPAPFHTPGGRDSVGWCETMPSVTRPRLERDEGLKWLLARKGRIAPATGHLCKNDFSPVDKFEHGRSAF